MSGGIDGEKSNFFPQIRPRESAGQVPERAVSSPWGISVTVSLFMARKFITGRLDWRSTSIVPIGTGILMKIFLDDPEAALSKIRSSCVTVTPIYTPNIRSSCSILVLYRAQIHEAHGSVPCPSNSDWLRGNLYETLTSGIGRNGRGQFLSVE